MSRRKSGDFAESIFDLGLGMLGAAAHGFGVLTKNRQQRKDDRSGHSDIVDDITLGMQAAFERGQEVVDEAVKDLVSPSQQRDAAE